MTPPLLLWDIDDVLNDLMSLFAATVAQKLKPGVKAAELKSNPPLEALDCTLETYLAALDECRENFLFGSLPKEEVRTFLRIRGGHFRSAALSSCPMNMAPRSAAWVLRHFGSWIQGVLFVPSPRKKIVIESFLYRSKAEAVCELGGILIDDAPANVEAVRKAGGRALCFPAPWNENRNMSYDEFFTLLLKETGVQK